MSRKITTDYRADALARNRASQAGEILRLASSPRPHSKRASDLLVTLQEQYRTAWGAAAYAELCEDIAIAQHPLFGAYV